MRFRVDFGVARRYNWGGMQISSKQALIHWLSGRVFSRVLDAPCGKGWLREALGSQVVLDGVDLFESPQLAYHRVWQHDLNQGLPAEAAEYDAIFCCEGIEHVGNPLKLLSDCLQHL